jgi:beta-galactosidase
MGSNLEAEAAAIRALDSTRPVHWEPVVREPAPFSRISDILPPMYPPIERLLALAEDPNDDRPVIMCVYAHAMGNSCGNRGVLGRHRVAPPPAGGFIRDWVVQGLQQEQRMGRLGLPTEAIREDPHDGPTASKTRTPDRVPHPSLIEYKR